MLEKLLAFILAGIGLYVLFTYPRIFTLPIIVIGLIVGFVAYLIWG